MELVRRDKSLQIGMGRKSVLRRVERMRIEVVVLDLDTLRERVLDFYAREMVRRQGKVPPSPDADWYDRITVNALRHHLTLIDGDTYDMVLWRYRKKRTDTGMQRLRERVLDAIAATYPHLAEECERQRQAKVKLPTQLSEKHVDDRHQGWDKEGEDDD